MGLRLRSQPAWRQWVATECRFVVDTGRRKSRYQTECARRAGGYARTKSVPVRIRSAPLLPASPSREPTHATLSAISAQVTAWGRNVGGGRVCGGGGHAARAPCRLASTFSHSGQPSAGGRCFPLLSAVSVALSVERSGPRDGPNTRWRLVAATDGSSSDFDVPPRRRSRTIGRYDRTQPFATGRQIRSTPDTGDQPHRDLPGRRQPVAQGASFRKRHLLPASPHQAYVIRSLIGWYAGSAIGTCRPAMSNGCVESRPSALK
jgi:hypothetical protein